MNVLFDHQIFVMQKYGGISRYYCELFTRLSELGVSYDISTLIHKNYYLKRGVYLPFSFMGQRKLFSNINKGFLKHKIKKNNFDIFHATYDDPYFIKQLENTKKPLVVTIHDMIYELFSIDTDNHRSLIEKRKKIIERSDKIISVSKNTKNDLIKYYNIDPAKIKVIYHGAPSIKIDRIKKYNFGKYIIFVGRRGWYKNFDILLNSFSLIVKSFPEINLICAGGGKFLESEIKKIEKLKLQGKVFQLTPNDIELFSLYNDAQLFVFSSKYEGFGLPVLEAFNANCPVLLSNSSCFPEIAMDAALYFENDNQNDLVEKILLLLNDKRLQEKMRKKGKKRLEFFSWEKSAKETVVLYQELIP